MIGLFKAELIKPRGPWRTAEQVELATLEYVDWFNHRRLYEACGDIPPAELEAAYYSQNAVLTEAGNNNLSLRTHRGDSMDTYGHLFPDSEDLGRGAIDAIFAVALTEQERNQETR